MDGMDMNQMPALNPPDGVTSNFVDPFSLNSSVVATLVLCLSTASFSLFARLVTSFRAFKSIRVEDCK
jgi:hypothetical protein